MNQSKKSPHGNSNTHTTDRMVKYDPENAQAWAVIMQKVRYEYNAGSTQLEIAKKLGVTKVAVSRWLSQERGGERTTFGDMVRYARALNIPFNHLVSMPCECASPELTDYDRALGIVLKRAVSDAELTSQELAHHTGLKEEQVNSILDGKSIVSGATLNRICTAVEVGASILLKKADKLVRTE